MTITDHLGPMLELVRSGFTRRQAAIMRGVPWIDLVKHLSENAESQRAFEEAEQWQSEALADEALSILDDADVDNPAALKKAELQAKYRMLIAEKRAPKRYGNKVQVEGSLGLGALLEKLDANAKTPNQ